RAWVRAPAERGSEIPRGILAGRVTPEGAYNGRPFIDALQANDLFNPSLTIGGATWASRAMGPPCVGGKSRPSGRMRGGPPDPSAGPQTPRRPRAWPTGRFRSWLESPIS